jgi:predicted Zn-dependent protease
MRAAAIVLSALFALSTAAPARAQFGGLGKIKSGADTAANMKQKADELHINEQQERQIGEGVSLSLRQRFGVMQDQAVTKYVTLVGATLAQASTRPKLDWKFIVLDTDAVNAFAAPGGIIHVTRGLLGFCTNEAELAGVLGHEITHVTEKHAIGFIEKSKGISMGTDAVGAKEGYAAEIVAKATERLGHFLLDNEYSQANEDQSDEIGVQLANKLGYDPHGLQDVLKRLDARNTGRQEKNGMFSSHPATKDRIGNVQRIIDKNKLAGKATVAARYKQNITFEAKPVTAIAMDTSGASGLASGDKKKPDDQSSDTGSPSGDTGKKGGRFGLGGVSGGGKQAQSNQQVASAGARGVGVPDRDAKGGSNSNLVNVRVTPAELVEFKKGIVA